MLMLLLICSSRAMPSGPALHSDKLVRFPHLTRGINFAGVLGSCPAAFSMPPLIYTLAFIVGEPGGHSHAVAMSVLRERGTNICGHSFPMHKLIVQ